MGMCQSAPSGPKAGATGSPLPKDAAVVFVLGGPGSGKGTQCEKIAARYDCEHISAGDLLRAEVASGSDLGKECETLMKEGKLVPLETTLSLLQKAMLESSKKTFLIDGFPRAIEQATRFEAEIQKCTACLFFECSEEVMTQRLLNRGKTSGRTDDNEETIKKRFKTFVEMSEPVANFYETQGKCYRVSGEDAPDVVFEHVQSALDAYLKANPSKSTPVETSPAAPESDASAPEPKETTPTGADETTPAEPAAAAEPALGRIVFVLGGPGSGKGTQCERIVSDYQFRHISVGDLLRAEVESGSDLGKECEELMKDGKLVPLQTTVEILKKALTEGAAECCLIDGFPRSIEQAELFERQVAPCDAVIYFECSEEVMLKRMTERAKSSGRVDDNPETMQKRLATFFEVSAPVARFYTEQGKCHTLSAEREPSEIYTDVQVVMDALKKSTPPQEASNAEEPAIETQKGKILILEDAASKTAEALSKTLCQRGWECVSRPFSEGEDLAAIGAKAVVWNPCGLSEEAEAKLSPLLKELSEQGVLILPSLEAVAAAKDDDFAKKISGADPVEAAHRLTVELAFATPIEVISHGADAEKEEEEKITLKPDDPEIAPVLEQLMKEDLAKIRAASHEVLPPLWSAVYAVVEEDEAKSYFFSKLVCHPLDLSERLECVDAIAEQIAQALST